MSETKYPEIITVTPFGDKNNYPLKKGLDKKGMLISVSIALSFLAVMSYYINFSMIRNIGAVITILACGYSIYNISKVNLK